MRRVLVRTQYALPRADLPPPHLLTQWVKTAAQHMPGNGTLEVTVRVVGIAEMTELNQNYRHKNGPTNVLSFNYEMPPGIDIAQLADIVICAPYANEESAALGISRIAHWAHLVIHGTLHIFGLDHEEPKMAADMESLEGQILTQLGYPNPYSATVLEL